MKKMMILGMIAMAFTSCSTINSGMFVTDEQTSLNIDEKELTTEYKSSEEPSFKVRIHPAEK